MENKNENKESIEDIINKHLKIIETFIEEKGLPMQTVCRSTAITSLGSIADFIKTYFLFCSKDFKINLISLNKEMIQKNKQVGLKTQSQFLIIETCDEIKEMLLDKNRKYGDSALNPQRIFSKANMIEQINVRIDDKLSRIKSGQADENEDVEKDLLGYLILKKIAIKILQINNIEEKSK